MKNVPCHLGIILDGNRRWAEEKGLPSLQGHRRGLEKAKEVVKWCKDKEIKILTLFIFSTENWKRAKKEVDYLMSLAKQIIGKHLKELHKSKIRVRIIGEKDKLPKPLQQAIAKAEALTKNNKEMVLNFALSYGGRAEIVQAIKNIIQKKISPEKITEDVISENLWTTDLDLIIRTGREQRISNFLIWQAAYSELYFSKKYWPDFIEKDLDEAIADYATRQRRTGK